ncbi:unnamed protein product [Rotaria sordida]|uniref:Uncharacterized protein n=1 Tax=Rotaria sordida TaxID=392033 RepID=A0A814YER2_9BILA|nr:unnamed protein product [Rotaria sordida]CAF1228003.1 unnamed protein product [Rotaria sordida]CAF1229708.1 unnamed protein product [Rotaria sordida]
MGLQYICITYKGSYSVFYLITVTSSWLAACDELTSVEFFKEVKKYEATFKKADHYVESIESILVETDDDEESDPDLDGDDNSKNSDYEQRRNQDF